jgi:alpha-L-rhamnosidase
MYQTYDVTGLLHEGSNALGATIADGWYAGRLALTGDSVNWGNRLALLRQLEIAYADGSMNIIAADETFKSSTDPIRYADLLIRQKYGARLKHPGWSTSGFDDFQWTQVTAVDYPLTYLLAQYREPVRKFAEIPAIKVFVTPKGEKIVDFGRNVARHVRMGVTGAAGTEVVLAHTETLD